MIDPALRSLLARFEAAVLVDPVVLGVFSTGSLGRGTADRFADLDLEVRLAGDAVGGVPAKRQNHRAALGPIGWSTILAPGSTIAPVDHHWRRDDVHGRDETP